MDIKRKDAARLLENIAKYVAEEIHGHTTPSASWAKDIEKMLTDAGVDAFRPCNGEAHSNPHIDNCGVCMRSGHWGWVGGNVKVK